MTTPITGGCRCGALRYECPAEPVLSVACSCSDCKVFYGGVISAALVLPRDAVQITGAVTYYQVEGSSGRPVDRGFCPTCGTQVFGKPGVAPQLMSVTAGTLDDPSSFRPQMNVFAANAYDWVYLDSDIVSFPGMPDQIPEV
jgi:hypothetical protein